MKIRKNVSLDEETVIKIEELAKASHKSVSQWITDAVWLADDTARKNNKIKRGKNNG